MRAGSSYVLAAYCPDWPVAAAGLPDDVPAAVTAKGAVVACSAAARVEGVRPGLRAREAQRRCPTLAIVDSDPGRDARAFEPVVRALEALTPRLEVVQPGIVAFPARGAIRHAGGVEVLVASVTRAVEQAGGRGCRVGVADGVFAAVLAARRGVVVPVGRTVEFLAPLPVADLGRPELADLLIRLGVPTLGAFAALPAGDVADRFGADGARAHRLARGREEYPLDPRPPPPDLTVQAELDPPVEQAEAAVFLVKALADELHVRLTRAGLACSQVIIEAETEHGERLARRWRHEGALSAGQLADRARWQLDGWLSGDRRTERPTAGVSLLRLVPDGLAEAGSGQLGLWGEPGVHDEQVSRVLARLQGLLGPDEVLAAVLGGGRDPAERVTWVPWGEPRQPRLPAEAPWPGRLPVPSPASLPTAPVSAALLDATGRPVTVSGRAVVSAAPASLTVSGRTPASVAGWAGPWPVDARWWDPPARCRRARLQVATDDGQAFLLGCSNGEWHVEGIYD